MRKTKIICTLGPAVEAEEVMRELAIKGMDVARLNFSHGSHEYHLKLINTIKRIRSEINKPIALMLDTKGPEIRLGCFENGEIELRANDRFVLTTEECIGNKERAFVTYQDLPKTVQKEDKILLDDGLVELRVDETDDTQIVCRVMNNGVIRDRKSVNVPGVRLDMPYLSEEDEKDILFAIEHDFDYIAASFVRRADDLNDLRNLLEKHGGRDIQIIAKIENSEGVESIDDILEVSDGIMVAREIWAWK